MSLINEALRKAQQARSGEAGGEAAGPGASPTQPGKRGEPRSARSVLWLTIGGAALVLGTGFATFWWLNRPAPELPVAAPRPPARALVAPEKTAPPPAPIAAAVEAPKPVAPAAVPVKPPTPQPASTAPQSPPAATPPVPTPPAPRPTNPPPSHDPTPPLPTPPTAASAAPRSDERVHAFVDSIKVTGIRSSAATVVY
jgi:hypothetical protein